MKKDQKQKRIRIGLAAGGAVLVIGLIVFALRPSNDASAAGLEYLENQAAADITQIEKDVTAKKNEHLIESVKNGDTSIFSLYRNSLILGDSRVYGFDSYGFVPGEQVLAAAGTTIANIEDNLEIIQRMQPQVMYFSYGVNDMGLQIGSDRGENGYAQVYEEQIDKALSVSPNSQIVVNSIIPVTQAAKERSPRWDQAEDYNRQIQEMCERRGWTYVDNTDLADNGNAPIYQGDGVHFLPDFYPVWASNMLFEARA